MNALIPLFVALPLISAFLVMILGKLGNGFHRILAPLILLILLAMAMYEFSMAGRAPFIYTMGGWSTVGTRAPPS
jgi:formate hydrogenlyase subunit 3/multisubunit Na+/H+ antiporter MnhD subunit